MIPKEILEINAVIAQGFAIVLLAFTIGLYFIRKMMKEDAEKSRKK